MLRPFDFPEVAIAVHNAGTRNQSAHELSDLVNAKYIQYIGQGKR